MWKTATTLALVLITLACDSVSRSSGPSAFLRVTSIVPNTGYTDSTVTVQITGTGFEPGATVSLGSAATNVTVLSSTTISATAPMHAAGVFDVVVTNPRGVSAALATGFSYVVFAVTSVSPASGLVNDRVAIIGTGFRPGATLTIGGAAATITSFSSTRIQAAVPAHAPGPADILVTNPGGPTTLLASAFTFEEVTLSTTATVVAAGADLSVRWTAPSGRSTVDWIGLFKVGEPNVNYLAFIYTNGATSGTGTFTAPSDPGQYEFRYLLNDDYTDVARSQPFTVTAEPPAHHSGLCRAW